MHMGWLLRKEKEREEEEGGGGRRQLHLEILDVKSKILRVARVYMIQLGYKYFQLQYQKLLSYPLK